MPWSKAGFGTHPVDRSVEKVDKLPICEDYEGLSLHISGKVLGVFAKQPVPGKVKTRLTPPLSMPEAAAFYQVMLRQTVERVQQILSLTPVLIYDGDRRWFVDQYPDLLCLPQVAGDLGSRLQAASHQLFSCGAEKVALMGSDSPDLPLSRIEQAFQLLDSVDSSIIPASDGGYVLVGMSRLCPELFEAIPWSTASVLAKTKQQAAKFCTSLKILPSWFDVDRQEDLSRLVERTPDCSSARYVKECLHRVL